jgi:hypothetical protein
MEADGPFHPDKFTALEYGFAVLDPRKLRFKDLQSYKEATIELKRWAVERDPNCESDPVTMKEFWNLPKMRPVYDSLIKEGRPVKEVMREIGAWIEDLNGKYEQVRWIMAPVSYDNLWIARDLNRHTDVRLPISVECASSARKEAIRQLETAHWLAGAPTDPLERAQWLATKPYVQCDSDAFKEQLDIFGIGHDHTAQSDALEQGLQYFACRAIDFTQSTMTPPEEGPDKKEKEKKKKKKYTPKLVFFDTVPMPEEKGDDDDS